MRLEGKVALVTGAGAGIGEGIAILFAKEGAKVSVVDIDDSGGQETVKMIAQNGGVAQFIHADVSKESDVEGAVKATVNSYNRLDIMVNNAGIVQGYIPVDEMDEKFWDNMFAINMKGVMLGCKYAVRVMKEQGGGSIINTSSVWGTNPAPGVGAYAASKGGVIALTKSVALEAASHKIRVNSVCPAGILTPIWRQYAPSDKELEEMVKNWNVMSPLGVGKPEDIAYAYLYLASDESHLVTGINLVHDSGLTTGLFQA